MRLYALISLETKMIHKVRSKTVNSVITSKFISNHSFIISIISNHQQKYFLQLEHHIELLIYL